MVSIWPCSQCCSHLLDVCFNLSVRIKVSQKKANLDISSDCLVLYCRTELFRSHKCGLTIGCDAKYYT